MKHFLLFIILWALFSIAMRWLTVSVHKYPTEATMFAGALMSAFVVFLIKIKMPNDPTT